MDTILTFPIELKRPKWLVGMYLLNSIGFGMAGCFQLIIGIPLGSALVCCAVLWGFGWWWSAYVPYIRFTQHEIIIPPNTYHEWDSVQSLTLVKNALEVQFVNHKKRRFGVHRGDKAIIERIISRMKPASSHTGEE